MTEREKHRLAFVRGYKMAWYQKGQLYGEYLWDVPYESFEGDLSTAEEIANHQYDKQRPQS